MKELVVEFGARVERAMLTNPAKRLVTGGFTGPLHNVQIGQYDSPVQIIPLYNIQGKRPKFCFGGQFSLSRTLILHDMVSISCFHIFLGH